MNAVVRRIMNLWASPVKPADRLRVDLCMAGVMVALIPVLFFAACAVSHGAGQKSISAIHHVPDDAVPATVRDLAGHPVDPFERNGAKAIVLIFISNDCPISNRYAPEIRRLCRRFSSRGVRFWLVHPNPDESIGAIRQHTKAYQYPCGVLRDLQHALVKKAGARVTPEAAVFTSRRQRVYHGRIDDRFLDFGQERPEPTRHDLQEALEACLGGKPVPVDTTKAIGCAIPELP